MIFAARYGIIASTFPSAVTPQDFNAILSEDGSYMLQQDNLSKILIESGSGPAVTNFNLYSSYGQLIPISDSSSNAESSYGELIFIQ